MSETETRELSPWSQAIQRLTAERDAARAEVARLREAIEAVAKALGTAQRQWMNLNTPKRYPIGLAGKALISELFTDLRAALAPVEPSGEAESGEPVLLTWLTCTSCRGRTLARPGSRCSHCNGPAEPDTPAPVPSGGQADGPVGETGHRWPCPRFYVTAPATDRCTCGQVDGEGEALAAMLHTHAEQRRVEHGPSAAADNLDWIACKVAALAARPVLSREALSGVLAEVADERARQTAKHGDQSHLPDGTGPYALDDLDTRRDRYAVGTERWAKARTKAASQNEGGDGSITFEHILTEEWAEAVAESDPDRLRAELIQVAAVAVQWVEAIDGRAHVLAGEQR